jgi:hypothetical protein
MVAASYLQTARAMGPTSIWMVNADGLNPRLVYTGTGEIVATAWSPRWREDRLRHVDGDSAGV